MPIRHSRIGVKRQRVEIQVEESVRDEAGGVANSFITKAKRWARVEPLRGREFFEASQTNSSVTHRVRMRHFPGLTTRHRLLYNGRVLSIRSVMNIDEQNIEDELLCEERDSG